jgi:CHASE3 domain sensor protein
MNQEQKELAHAAATSWRELVHEVQMMRANQRAYFITRDRNLLIASKKHEEIVDAALREYLSKDETA